MTTRVKIKKSGIETREEAERVVGELAEVVLLREAATNQMEQLLADVRQKYEGYLVETGKEIQVKLAIVQDWAEANPDLFGKKKSLEMVHATIGFRTGMPQCKTASGWTWEKVKAHLLNAGLGYTRSTTVVDKDAIIADRKKLGVDGLNKMRVRVVQDDSFFVEPKREKTGG